MLEIITEKYGSDMYRSCDSNPLRKYDLSFSVHIFFYSGTLNSDIIKNTIYMYVGEN